MADILAARKVNCLSSAEIARNLAGNSAEIQGSGDDQDIDGSPRFVPDASIV
jgi:hypothetical protein